VHGLVVVAVLQGTVAVAVAVGTSRSGTDTGTAVVAGTGSAEVAGTGMGTGTSAADWDSSRKYTYHSLEGFGKTRVCTSCGDEKEEDECGHHTVNRTSNSHTSQVSS
jgi:hypothetical protein